MSAEHASGVTVVSAEYKISTVFASLGNQVDEERFISSFKQMYPDDWVKIKERWQLEEDNTPPGKKHPMQHPDVYMKEMYRNHKPRGFEENNGT